MLNQIRAVAHATGLVDETVNAQNLYSKYSLGHYQLDFFVDNSWDWLPWNWSDGIGKSVMYGLYAITNFIGTVSLYLSNATGYVIQEAYKLDFISDTADAIGKNIQALAGITSSGFSSEGFYIGFLLLFVLIIGVYVAYVGLIRRESSKAIQAVINFVTVFCCLHLLSPMRQVTSRKSMTFHLISANQRCRWVLRSWCRMRKVLRKIVWI